MLHSTSIHSDSRGESKYRIKERKQALLGVIPVKELFCEHISVIQGTRKYHVNLLNDVLFCAIKPRHVLESVHTWQGVLCCNVLPVFLNQTVHSQWLWIFALTHFVA